MKKILFIGLCWLVMITLETADGSDGFPQGRVDQICFNRARESIFQSSWAIREE